MVKILNIAFVKIILLLFCISPSVFSHNIILTYASFSIDQKEVVWIHNYHQNETSENLREKIYDLLKRKAWIKNVRYDGPEIIADIEDFRVDYKRYGGKYLDTSALIRSAKWKGKLRVSFKEGKYRILVYGLQYEALQPSMNSGKMSYGAHLIHGTWSDWVLNSYRTAFKKRRYKNMHFMHVSLKDGFTVHDTQVMDNDW